MNNEIIYKSILALGLSDLAAKIYLCLFEISNPTITDIANNLKLHRAKVYESMQILLEKKLIQADLTKKAKYSVVSPARILSQISVKTSQYQILFQELNRELPKLETEYFKSKPKDNILQIHDGENEVNQLVFDMYNQVKKEVLFLGNADAYSVSIGMRRLEQLAIQRADKDIAIKVLATNFNRFWHHQSSEDEVLKRQVRKLPDGFSSLDSFHIFDSKVVIWNTAVPRGILIEDEMTTEFFRNIFMSIWCSSQELKGK